MMNEYIDKAEALSRFSFYNGDRIPEKDIDGFPNTITFHDAKMVIRSIRPADVLPVIHGRWVYKGFEKGWECSVCGSRCLLNYESDFYKSDFCPHCGADMREDKA